MKNIIELLPLFSYNFSMESSQKQKNFKRIAEARVEKALDMMDLIGNLSNTSFYEYTEEDIDKIFKTLQESLDKNKDKFNKDNKQKAKRRFTL